MSVVVAGPAETAAAYLAWDPLAEQVAEPDTTYLMDLDVEEAKLTVAQGRMIGANEQFGTSADLPYWLGGTKVARVPGKYSDGLKCMGDTTYGHLVIPASGLVPPDQFTIEWFVRSDLIWSSLSNQMMFSLLNDAESYIQVIVNSGTVRVDYRHTQHPVADVYRQPAIGSQAHAADVDVSVALTQLGSTLKVYIEGVLVATDTQSTPPVLWDDSWQGKRGLAVSVGSPDLSVSGLRVSRLCRVPGEVPTP